VRELEDESYRLVDYKEFEKSAASFEQLTALRESLGEPPTRSLANDYLAKSYALMRCMKLADALTSARKGFEIACGSDGDYSPIAAKALKEMGIDYGDLGQSVDAIRALNRGSKIWLLRWSSSISVNTVALRSPYQRRDASLGLNQVLLSQIE
jgi:hypothetical protein